MDMFSTKGPAVGSVRIVLEVSGTIPSFKNNKMIIPPSTKGLRIAVESGDLQAAKRELQSLKSKRPLMITKPEYQEAMRMITAGFVSQLKSAFQTTAAPTCPASSIRSWIASSTPGDDCWERIPEINIYGVKCNPGEEGATILIEKI